MNRRAKSYLAVIVVLAIIGGVAAYIMAEYAKGRTESQIAEYKVEKFDDVRAFNDGLHTNKKDISYYDFTKEENPKDLIWNLRFNDRTKWPSSEMMPKDVKPSEILEWGKSAGLGIDKLHKKGITGKGVNIGIIDQPIYTEHPEYAHAIKAYNTFGETDMKGGAMGSAYVSILAGKNTGVAPEANIYYAGVAMDSLDVAVYGLAIDWFIERNEKLPALEKIRVIAVPTALDGETSPFEENKNLWNEYLKKAENAGITILDCTTRNQFGSVYFGENRDSFKALRPGYPDDETKDVSMSSLLVPTGAFSVAEEYKVGDKGYQYIPKGGVNFTVPYATGVLALALQGATFSTRVNLDRDAIYKGMKDTAYKLKLPGKQFNVINPAKYVDYLGGK